MKYFLKFYERLARFEFIFDKFLQKSYLVTMPNIMLIVRANADL